jgi:A/G-specific adenine glycosylase
MDWFAGRLVRWYDKHGRKDLPWQSEPRDPYRIWVSEVMLQQTQVATALPFYEGFVKRFPSVSSLAAANQDAVLHLWTGLGYYARARNLHAAAQALIEHHNGKLPEDLDALQALPGIGRSTAGAILASAFEIRAPILDGNVRRVLARFHCVDGQPGKAATEKALWAHAEKHTPKEQEKLRDFTQAIMDLGATVCSRSSPDCDHCPVSKRCAALEADLVDQYPQPRPRKALPTRDVRMFLIIDPAGRCLLERRPPSGLWGGLWTPPERDADYSPDRLLEELGLDATIVFNTSILDAFTHTFSHFHLTIEPVQVYLARTPHTVQEEGSRRWYHPLDKDELGLSAAAVKLLDTVR